LGVQVSRHQAGARDAAAASRGVALPLGVKLALLGGGALLAFYPLTVDLARHLSAEPWARYALLFPGLFAWCALRTRGPVAASRSGALWIAAAVALQTLAIAGGVPRYGRPALPLALIGGARLLGLAPLRIALLPLLAIPIPTALVSVPSPALERIWLGLVAPWLDAGALISLRDPAVMATGGTLILIHADAGLPLAALLAGLAWYAGARLGWSPVTTAAALLAALPTALAVQAGAVASAALAVGWSADAEAVRTLLTHAPWLATALLVIPAVEWRVREAR
jgi:hypothetical protein